MALTDTTTDSIILEKLEVMAQQFIDMVTLRSSLEIESFQDYALQRLCFRIRGYVLAEEVDKRSMIVKFRIDIPATWWQHFKQSLFPQWLLNRTPVKHYTIERNKKVTFRRLATYPKASLILPKEVSNAVVYRTQIYEDLS